MRLSRGFYERSAVDVARDVLGMVLVRHRNGERLSGVIVEAEAYRHDDTACHAYRGKTKRNAVMFGGPGIAYVYFVYGMHHMFNVVAEPEGFAAAVLVRAVAPREGVETMQALRGHTQGGAALPALSAGPARLTQALAIDRGLNGADVVQGGDVWIEEGAAVADADVQCGPRIGIGYAAESDLLAPWRFWVRGNPFVSRAPTRR
jgi:DNA-3-methyladenine glycosylase